jgi:hypothetical protein
MTSHNTMFEPMLRDPRKEQRFFFAIKIRSNNVVPCNVGGRRERVYYGVVMLMHGASSNIDSGTLGFTNLFIAGLFYRKMYCFRKIVGICCCGGSKVHSKFIRFILVNAKRGYWIQPSRSSS